jgi:hypothetical protein
MSFFFLIMTSVVDSQKFQKDSSVAAELLMMHDFRYFFSTDHKIRIQPDPYLIGLLDLYLGLRTRGSISEITIYGSTTLVKADVRYQRSTSRYL